MSILWNPAEATVVEKVSLPIITTGTQNMGDGIYWLKAGTPLDEDYAVANDEDAMYIVAEDFFFVSTNPNQDRHVPLVKAGYVDINKAEASAGITFADAAKSALETAGIVLVDGLLDTSGGGGGGGSDLLFCEVDPIQVSASMSSTEIAEAIAAGKKVMLVVVDSTRGDIPGGFFYISGPDAMAMASYVDGSTSELFSLSVYVEGTYADVTTTTFTLTPAE